ncbi:MAG: helix-hairpin-helix domain-containing protein [Bacteroidetes bacterium]|nr:helix-hairpin-helix domain-containing protein [Bacteroidota bacterium]MBU1717790.1 helix-hairpin-helix domain-containing protein [Bacteroidota bacterium]
MRNPFLYIVLFLLFGCSLKVSAQIIPPIESPVEDKIENMAENIDETSDIDFSVLYEQLEYLKESPINLNTADRDELSNLIILDEFQILTFLDYREKFGNLSSFYELQAIDGWDFGTIQRIMPYITLKVQEKAEKISFNQLMKRGKNMLLIRGQGVLEEMEGYSEASDSLLEVKPNSRYLGNPAKIYAKYQYKYKNRIIMGATFEKDPGEQFFKGSQKGFDFTSVHFLAKDFGWVKRLALGDFEAKFGQGLVFWSGLAFGKSTDAMSVAKNASGLKQYSSANESGFLRGGGVTLGNKNFDFTVFASSRSIDANMAIDSTSQEEATVSSLLEDGYHRTPAEMADRKTLDQQVIGGNFTWRGHNYRVGLTGAYTKFGMPVVRNTQLYNMYEFSGDENADAGIDYIFHHKQITLAGETGISENGAMATLNTAALTLSPRVSFSLAQRYYAVDYQPVMSAAFGENSKNANESGLYYGILVYPASGWTLTGFYDLFRFKWLRYQTDSPTDGHDAFIDAKYKPNRKTDITFRFREKEKAQTFSQEEALIDGTDTYRKHTYRVHLNYRATSTITLKTRAEIINNKFANKPTSEGYLVYQDINFRSNRAPYDISFRYALFDTDDYDSRIYAFENDVLYAFSISPYYYRGSRFYFLVKYEFTDRIQAWFRIGQTWYNDRDVISSGLNEISGNTRTEVKLQIKFRL